MARAKGAEAVSAAREARVIELRMEGKTFDFIGAALDPPVSRQRAHQIYQEACARIPAEKMAEHRALEMARYDAWTAEAYVVLRANHIAVSNGRVVMIAGEDGVERPVVDYGPRLAALKELRGISQERRKLLGLDAPVKTKHITQTELEAEIEELEAEVAAMGGVIPDE